MKDGYYILVYGSLRKNSKRGFNFGRFGSESQIYIKDVVLDGYVMHSLGVYPAVREGKGKIKCELHKVNFLTMANLYSMETDAGYKEKKVKLDTGEEAYIFLMPDEILREYPVVKSGDWK